MRGRMLLGLAILAAAPAFALSAAHGPTALAQAGPGLWELDIPGKPALRQCIMDVAVLAQFEHRGRHCQQNAIADTPGSASVQYSCGGGDFGRSDIETVTPRSFRISTQGISGGLPFNYVLIARRVGECMKNPSSPRH